MYMGKENIDPKALDFLRKLEQNNNREWFETHKPEFKAIQSEVKAFYEQVMWRLQAHDEIERLKMFRIYRDVRFSADKTPYKSHFAGSFSRAGEARRGGYYLRIKPGETFAAVGFWNPEKEDLLRIRKELELDASEFRGVIADTSLKDQWGELQGDALKTAPKGFDRDHSDIDLIRRKQFIFSKKFSDQEVTSPEFISQVDHAFRSIRPFFDLMSSILTTNLNGESLLD